MSALAALEKRLRFFGINKNTKSDLAGFMPVLLPNIDAFTEKFYGHTRNFPEARDLLAPHYKSSL